MSNKSLWAKAFTTDPRAVKPITGKQYKGNSPKPYWIVERLTDEFGPCGIGWGFTILGERFERFSDTESLHIASLRFWFVLDSKRGEFEQIGQTRSSYLTKDGKFIVDEDAPKKSVTDALVKCASYLGFAGDIFSGMWDDSKYVQWAGEEWNKREIEEEAKKHAAWLEEVAMKMESSENMAELGEVWKSAAKKLKAEGDGDGLATLEPIKDRMKEFFAKKVAA